MEHHARSVAEPLYGLHSCCCRAAVGGSLWQIWQKFGKFAHAMSSISPAPDTQVRASAWTSTCMGEAAVCSIVETTCTLHERFLMSMLSIASCCCHSIVPDVLHDMSTASVVSGGGWQEAVRSSFSFLFLYADHGHPSEQSHVLLKVRIMSCSSDFFVPVHFILGPCALAALHHCGIFYCVDLIYHCSHYHVT